MINLCAKKYIQTKKPSQVRRKSNYIIRISAWLKCRGFNLQNCLRRQYQMRIFSWESTYITLFFVFCQKTIQYNPTKDLFRRIIQIFSTAQRNFELLRQSWAKDLMTMMMMMMTRQSWEEEVTTDDDDDDETILGERSHRWCCHDPHVASPLQHRSSMFESLTMRIIIKIEMEDIFFV